VDHRFDICWRCLKPTSSNQTTVSFGPKRKNYQSHSAHWLISEHTLFGCPRSWPFFFGMYQFAIKAGIQRPYDSLGFCDHFPMFHPYRWREKECHSTMISKLAASLHEVSESLEISKYNYSNHYNGNSVFDQVFQAKFAFPWAAGASVFNLIPKTRGISK